MLHRRMLHCSILIHNHVTGMRDLVNRMEYRGRRMV